MSHSNYAEACVEYFEAADALKRFEQARRPGHSCICDCDEECIARRSKLNALGFACADAFARASAMREIGQRAMRTADEKHPRAHDESWVAKFNEEQR